jgi:hypothetical protein
MRQDIGVPADARVAQEDRIVLAAQEGVVVGRIDCVQLADGVDGAAAESAPSIHNLPSGPSAAFPTSW